MCQVLPTTPHPCEKGFTHPTSEEESGLPHAAQLHGGQRSLCPALWGLQTGRHTASSGCCSKLLETEWLTTAGIYSYSSGGRKSEFKMLSCLGPSGGSAGRSVRCLCPTCWWWPTILCVPWVVDPSLQSLPFQSLSSHIIFLCVSSPLLMKTLAIGLRAHSNLVQHITLI